MTMLTEHELCLILGVTRMFLYQSRRDGLPFIRLGDRLIRYNPDDVLSWFEERGARIKSSVQQ